VAAWRSASCSCSRSIATEILCSGCKTSVIDIHIETVRHSSFAGMYRHTVPSCATANGPQEGLSIASEHITAGRMFTHALTHSRTRGCLTSCESVPPKVLTKSGLKLDWQENNPGTRPRWFKEFPSSLTSYAKTDGKPSVARNAPSIE